MCVLFIVDIRTTVDTAPCVARSGNHWRAGTNDIGISLCVGVSLHENRLIGHDNVDNVAFMRTIRLGAGKERQNAVRTISMMHKDRSGFVEWFVGSV